jgi:hypothetical protein
MTEKNTFVSRVSYTDYEGDCCNDMPQHLEVSLESGGGGHFACLRTDRWAVTPEDLHDLADELEALICAADRASGETEEEEEEESQPERVYSMTKVDGSWHNLKNGRYLPIHSEVGTPLRDFCGERDIPLGECYDWRYVTQAGSSFPVTSLDETPRDIVARNITTNLPKEAEF